jgi:hypothetical protein
MGVDMNQKELRTKVYQVKRQVRDTIGTDLSHEFRSTQVYLAYCGLCGEAQVAYEEGELDDQTVTLLEEYAQKVIAVWQGGST